jgi:hypothetical protein
VSRASSDRQTQTINKEKVIMSNETNTTIQPSADPTPAPPATVQETLVAQLRAMRALIPDYTQLPVPEKKSLIVVAKGTDPEFIQSAINSVGASTNVQQAIGQTPEQLRQDTADAQSWTVVEDEARALLNGIAAGNLMRHYRIGKTALAVYSIASRLAQQQPEHSDLLPHVATMKRLNRFGVKKRLTKPATPSAPAPATPTAPPTTVHPVTAPATATAQPEPPKAS